MALRSSRHDLKAIARRAMVARGLRPDFSAEVLAEVGRLGGAAFVDDGVVRDLTQLPWASIDNVVSRDLDQLSVAEPPLAGGVVKVLVAIADVDALVKPGSAVD